ncbi:Trm112 family protein [Actimicrobium antarcticum]|uniref:UPF0434 protein GCM10022212_23500 n=1 Tax=Actimicrobium antarcticum TaxID=1051899 RepID=A0ABP7TER6_9BURK
MDTRLLDILVCPICKGPLDYDRKAQELICKADKLAYPIRDGIPIMWADEARETVVRQLVLPAAGEPL